MKNKKVGLAGILLSCLFLTGCTSALNDHQVSIKEANKKSPVIVSTYDYQGQKVDQVKMTAVKIKSNNQITSAIDVKYDENKIVHNNNPLIVYSGLTNFADQYDKNIANSKYIDEYGNPVKNPDKSHPIAGEIYGMFKKEFPEDGTVVIIKSKSGAPIGIFAGHIVRVKDFGDSENSNAYITLDNRRVFIYNSAYTIYPVSALKSMYYNHKATGTSHQAGVQTKSVAPMPNGDSKKSKK